MKKNIIANSFDQVVDYSADPDEDVFLSMMNDYAAEDSWSQDEQFKNYVPKVFPRKIAKELVELYPDLKFHNKKKLKKYVGKRGIIFTGPPGSGKTFMACCLAIMSKKPKGNWYYLGHDVAFYHISDLLDKLRNLVLRRKEIDPINGKDIYTSFLQDLTDYMGFLILDDVGTEKPTGFAFEALDRIINKRYENGGKIILTTNFDLATLVDMPGYNRIISRVLDMAEGQVITTSKIYRNTKPMMDQF